MRLLKTISGILCLISLSFPLGAQSVDPDNGVPDMGLFVEGTSLELAFADKAPEKGREYLISQVLTLLSDLRLESLINDEILDSAKRVQTSRLNSDGKVDHGVSLVSDDDINLFNNIIGENLNNEGLFEGGEFLEKLFETLDEDGAAILERYLDLIELGVITNPKDIPQSLLGIGGTATMDYIRNVCAYVNMPGFMPIRYRPGKTVDFHRNPDGSGQIEVIGVEKHFYTSSNLLYKKIIRDWKVSIAPGGFEIFMRDEGGVIDTSNPFPSAPSDADKGRLPDFMKDPEDLRSVWGRNLITKVHARGLHVQVTRVAERVQTMQNGKMVEAPETVFEIGGNEHYLLIPNEDSCVDYLFDSDPPPTSHHEFPEQRGYCLGRCATPDIINSF